MILIAHRGNSAGPNKSLENSPAYIDAAISDGYDVEIDLRVVHGEPFSGHDVPQYHLYEEYLLARLDKLWVHCKDMWAMKFCQENDFNFFFHDKDFYTLTSKGYIWAYPSSPTRGLSNVIRVLPETYPLTPQEENPAGICSDFVGKYV